MKPLAGRNIVITRPAAQSDKLAALVREQGGNPIVFPTLEIAPLENREALIELLSRLGGFDLAIFVSANAVTHSLPLLQGKWPSNVKAAAIGVATKRALEACGVTDALAPEGLADSEHFLALPELGDVRGKRVVVFRGQGGRELIRKTLVERGAIVEYAECYQRIIPNKDAAALTQLWAKKELHALVVTSAEALRNLVAMLPREARRDLYATPVFVPHPRIAEVARLLGCQQVVTVAQGDEGIMSGLAAWFGTRI